MKLDLPQREADWSDQHQGSIKPEFKTAKSAYHTAFATMPGWVAIAMYARNKLVRPLGLITETDVPSNKTGTNQPMQAYGTSGMGPSLDFMTRLPVLYHTQEHYELGMTDRHLTFTIATRLTDQTATITTRIWFNNWFGRLYLLIVLIPHKIIIRSALRRLS